MLRTQKFWLITLASLTLIISLLFYSLNFAKNVANSYIYGLPLVIMDHTRQIILKSHSDNPIPANSFIHVQKFPSHTFRNVVRPNVDTLYSGAWLDLSQGPQVLTVPAMGDRYYVVPFMDAYTNVFASVGTRSHGNQGGEYLIIGPQQNMPENPPLEVIQAPSNMVWVITRIQTNNQQDIQQVTQLQAGFSLNSLPHWRDGVAAHSQIHRNHKDDRHDIQAVVTQLSPQDFFNQLAQLLGQYPAPAQDTDALSTLANIGVIPGQSFVPGNAIEQFIMEKTLKLTYKKIAQEVENNQGQENGWTVIRDTIGNYGTDYEMRAGVALFGLGALPPQEAVYPNSTLDENGIPLNGQHEYRIHFEAGQLPPADAFWSLTMYDEQGYLIENPIHRYAIGDRDNLIFNDDGSLDIILQNKAPKNANSNWLPTPDAEFAVTMRLYLPQEKFLSGQWQLPHIQRLNGEG